MKKMKESIMNIIPAPNNLNMQKVINRADISLHDVLVNGMRLHRFKAYQHPLPILPSRPIINQLLHQEESTPTEESERMNRLFKNQQIKNRLKTVDRDFVSNLKIKMQSITPKKNQGVGLDASLYKRAPPSLQKKNSDSSAILKNVELTELNRSFKNNIQKQLEASATTSKLGVVEHRTQRGKYVGLRVSRERRKTIEKDYGLTDKNQDRSQIIEHVEKYKLIYLKKLQLQDSENKDQELISSVRMPQNRQKKLLKVCFSTRHKELGSVGIKNNFMKVNDAIKAYQL